MAKQVINIGSTANDRNGDPLRTAFAKVNANFTELYAASGGSSRVSQGTTPPQSPTAGDLWFDTNSGGLFVYFDSSWIDTAPAVSTDRLVNNGAELVLVHENGLIAVEFPVRGGNAIGISGNEMGAYPEPGTSNPSPLVLSSYNSSVWIAPNGQGPRPFWKFNQAGTVELPLPNLSVFTMTLSANKFVPRDGRSSITLSGNPWVFHGQYSANEFGSIQLAVDSIFPTQNNPGYVTGDEFTFSDQTHHLYGYTLHLTLNNVTHGGQGWTADLAFTAPPRLASTLYSEGAIDISTINGLTRTVSCYIGATGQFIAYDNEANIHDIQIGWTVDIEDVTYTVAGFPSGYPAGQYRINVPGATFQSSEVYTFRHPKNHWVFSTDGRLKLPMGGDIVDYTGTSVLGGASDRLISPDTDQVIRLDNTGALILPDNGAELYTPSEGSGNKDIDLYTNHWEGDAVEVYLQHNDKVSITTANGANEWAFANDGILSLPENGTVGAAVIQPNDTTFGLKLISNGNTFAFGTDGRLTLPGELYVNTGLNGAILGDQSTGGLNINVYEAAGFALNWNNADTSGTPSTNPEPGNPAFSTDDSSIAFGWNGINLIVNGTTTDSTWTFGPTGNLTLPLNGSVLNDGPTYTELADAEAAYFSNEEAYQNALYQWMTDASYKPVWFALTGREAYTRIAAWTRPQGILSLPDSILPLAHTCVTSYQYWQDLIADSKLTVKSDTTRFEFDSAGKLTLPHGGTISGGDPTVVQEAYDAWQAMEDDWITLITEGGLYTYPRPWTYATPDKRQAVTTAMWQAQQVGGITLGWGAISAALYNQVRTWLAVNANSVGLYNTWKKLSTSVNITSEDKTWTFTNDGILSLPGYGTSSSAVIQPNDNALGIKLISNGNTVALGTDGTLTIKNAIRSAAGQYYVASSDTSTEMSWTGNGGENVPVYSGVGNDNTGTWISTATTDISGGWLSKDWLFGVDGTTTFPSDSRLQAPQGHTLQLYTSTADDINAVQVNSKNIDIIAENISANSWAELFLDNTNSAHPSANIHVKGGGGSDQIWQFRDDAALVLPNTAIVRPSTNSAIANAETAYTAAIATWEYSRINDYMVGINLGIYTLEGHPFAGWDDVSGTTAPGYLAIVNQAWTVQNTPSSPPATLLFYPAITQSLYNQLRTQLNAVINTYNAMVALNKSVDIASGSQVLSLLGNGKLVVPDIIQNIVDEDLKIRTRYSTASSPSGSFAENNVDYTFGTNGYLTVPAGIASLVDDDLVIATRYTSALSGGGTAVVSKNFTFGTNGSLTFSNGSVILPSYTNLEITASNYIYLDSGNGGQVMIGGKETSGPVVLGRAGQNIAVYGNLKLTNGADIKDTTYNAVAFGENAGQNSQGWESVAIGPNAGKNTQGNFAVAVGTGAGYSSQHDLSVAVGKTAGWQTQGQAAVAVGTNAGYDGQGANAVAIGYKAGETSQHANSIIINATGSALNSSGTSRFYVDPIRNAAGDSILQYNAATKEVTYGTDPSKVTGSWTVASGANAVSITLPLNGTYSVWVNGNIPNGIVTYTATVVITNNNVPPVGTSYGWYYAAGNMLVLTSIPSQIVGTNGTISTTAGSGTTNNVFTFGITNNSGIDQMINWGYTKL